ncbi:MAG: hypothetical protein ACKOKF_11940 [Bacteroidota bacterium]
MRISLIQGFRMLLFFWSLLTHGASAQSALQATPKKSFKDRIFIGGNAGAQFGNLLVIDIGPQVGYRVTDRFTTGVGVRYIYYDEPRNPLASPENIYGGSLFARMSIYQGLFGYSEYELLNRSIDRSRRLNVGSLFVGGGYTQAVGNRSGIFVLLLYNLTESSYSIYPNNPIIRVGFGVGL